MHEENRVSMNFASVLPVLDPNYKRYYQDLKRSDFQTDDQFLEERVRRGLKEGYTFEQCFGHWLQDLADALECSDAGPVREQPTKYRYPTFPPNFQKVKEPERTEVQDPRDRQGTSV